MPGGDDPGGGRDTRGLRGGWANFQRHSFQQPAPDLAPFVARYWIVTWDLRGQPPYRQLIVPYPNVNLVFGDGSAYVRGVTTGPMVQVLAGAGRIFGVSFRPGCFRPFLGRSVSTITNRSVPVREAVGRDAPVAAMGAAPDDTARVGVAEGFLRPILPPPDPRAEDAAGAVARIAACPDLTRVCDLADRLGTGIRQVQRLFAGYVGASPKWVIRRYRLHEVTEQMATGRAIDWARLAADLGYADQAHLSRDFTAIAGEPPTRYAQRYPAAAD